MGVISSLSLRRTKAGVLAALVALLMLASTLPASADPGGAKPTNITWESSAGGNRIVLNISWE
jgi:hypothetical protein